MLQLYKNYEVQLRQYIQRQMQGGKKGWMWSNAKQWVQKQYFKVAHTIDLNINDQNSEEIWILGQFYNNQTARLIYSSTIWFTYRQNLIFKEENITSDVGWGCMLRVGQMMIAECIRRYSGLQNYSRIQTIEHIINKFITKQGPYSIQNLVNKGKESYQKGAGSWFTPSQTAFILRDIQNNNSNSSLKVLVFHNEFDSILALQYLKTSNKDKKTVPSKKMLQKNKESIKYDNDVQINPGLIIILIRIGMNEPQSQMIQSVLSLMHLSSFAGILGGKPGKAYYIIGTSNKNFIYLDPHCVKEGDNIAQFFSQNMFSLGHHKVDTSMAVCFYVNNISQFVLLSDALLSLKNNNAFLSYSMVQEPKLVQISQQDGFEVLM